MVGEIPGKVWVVGLSLYWELSAESDVDVHDLVRALHVSASSAGFDEVGEIVVARGDERVEGDDAIAARAWALSQGLATLHPDGEPARRVAPVEVVAFRAANPGTEDAVFGLARYDPVERLPKYRFSGGCSTQGASRRGGMPAFLKAHRAVIAVLDKARSLGLKVSVKDDGEFWQSRDPKKLIDKHEEWEGLMAALGRRRDEKKPCVLAADVKAKIEELRKRDRRYDRRSVVEELEG